MLIHFLRNQANFVTLVQVKGECLRNSDLCGIGPEH